VLAECPERGHAVAGQQGFIIVRQGPFELGTDFVVVIYDE
jgi:hypothetical protein